MEIAEAHAHPSIDDFQIVSLKRRKLLVKDELARLNTNPVNARTEWLRQAIEGYAAADELRMRPRTA